MTYRASIQLCSLRDSLAQRGLDATLADLSGTGLRYVEAFAFVDNAPEYAAALKRHGMTAPSGHAMFLSDHAAGDPATKAPELPRLLDAAAEVGIEFLINPFVPV